MRAHQPRSDPPPDFRRALERLESLPLRPISARLVLGGPPGDSLEATSDWLDSPKMKAVHALDPGWAIALARVGGAFDPLALIADRAWWNSNSGPGSEALTRLWRHAVAVSQAALRFAREAGDPEPERVARAGLLHGLGLWAVAAIDVEWIAAWLAESEPGERRELERRSLGNDLTTVGRTLAERWGCDPLVIDAAWLHADSSGVLNGCASEPRRLGWIQEAFGWAERAPWGLSPSAVRDPGPSDPRLRLLIAEVQVRCGAAFVEHDATPHEERLSRRNAHLLRQEAELRARLASSARMLDALAESDPAESPAAWAERAGLAWCAEPGVATARAIWPSAPALPSEEGPARSERPATWIVPLLDRGKPCAEVHLWTDSADPESLADPADNPARPAWQAWAALVAERARTHQRLEGVSRSFRGYVAEEEPRLREAKLEALAEFAAGAGHEMNNPLAVVVGRAQLLLARENDAETTRSLRAILGQAQRAHRILRDLMYVARPPEPRPRYCQPDEVVRNCLRDYKAEAEARGVAIQGESGDNLSKVWADPDALRHLVEMLLRNALEATPRGGKVVVATATDAASLHWSVLDTGRGLTAAEGRHLFDPFYCGRQAGRGLGLGLPRASTIVSQVGGELRWHSHPGQGSHFQVHIPLGAPPKPPQVETGGRARRASDG